VEREPIGTPSPIGRRADSLHRLTFRPIACASRRSSIPCQLNGQTDWHARAHRADTDPALELSRSPRSSCADVESSEKISRILRQQNIISISSCHETSLILGLFGAALDPAAYRAGRRGAVLGME